MSLTILLLNVKIAITAWKQSKHIRDEISTQQQNQAMMPNQMKITKMLVAVVGLFFMQHLCLVSY